MYVSSIDMRVVRGAGILRQAVLRIIIEMETYAVLTFRQATGNCGGMGFD
jgi:hypothetical protein